MSYGEIMDLVAVKKSTLATWCRDIELSAEQVEAIKARRAPLPGIPRDTQRKRRREIELIKAQAAAGVPDLVRDPLWMAGLVLYWAEGAKTRNQLRLANSDPRALRLFVRWVRVFLEPQASFSIQLHLHEGNNDAAARSYWQQELELPDANFYKTFIKPRGTGHRKNHLPHGVCSIKMRRCANAWHITMAWIERATLELGLDSGAG